MIETNRRQERTNSDDDDDDGGDGDDDGDDGKNDDRAGGWLKQIERRSGPTNANGSKSLKYLHIRESIFFSYSHIFNIFKISL